MIIEVQPGSELRKALDGVGLVGLRKLELCEHAIARELKSIKWQHPNETLIEQEARAKARVAWRTYRGNVTKTTSTKSFRTEVLLALLIMLILLLVFAAKPVHAQFTQANITKVGGQTVDPTVGMPIYCISGCSGGGGGGNVSITSPLDLSGNVKVAVQNSSLAVTGTFYQALQPISSTQLPTTLDTDGNLKVAVQNATLAVTGTFWQAVQPISGTVNVGNFPGSQAVTGPLTDVQLRAADVGVQVNNIPHIICDSGCSSGGGSSDVTVHDPTITTQKLAIDASGQLGINNFPATQPVSGTVGISGSVAVTGPLTDTQLRASSVPVSLTSTTVTGSVAVTNSSLGNLDVLLSTRTKPSDQQHTICDSGCYQATQPVSIASSIAVTGPLTDAQLRASAVPVSLTSTTVTNTVAVSATQLPATLDGSGFLKTHEQGTASISGTVTANAGTNLNTSALALDTTVTALEVAQASTTSGQNGILLQGATTTSAPTYITAKTNPLSLTTAGALRTDGSGVTQPVSLISTTITGSVAVTGPLTDAQLRASVVPVSLASTSITNTTFASTIADGADTTLGAKADAKSAATDTTAITLMQVMKEISFMEQNPASQAVTNTGTFAAQVTGTVTANAGSNLNTSALALESGGNLATLASTVRAEDSASADADKGIGALAIRKATPGNTSGTDGDYEYLQMSAGRLWTSAVIDSALPAGTNAIGSITNTSFGATQATAANLNATVVGTGTFVTQATLAAETTKIIGTVNIAAAQTIAVTNSGLSNLDVALSTRTKPSDQQHVLLDSNTGVDIGKLTANQSVNVAQMNGVTTSMGSGTMGTGVQRVAIASDNDPLTVKQGTAANLNATVVGTGTFQVQCSSGCGGAATFADSSAFTFSTTSVNNMSAVVDDVSTNTVAENSAGALRMSTNRILFADLKNTQTNTNALNVQFPSAQAVTLTSTAITGNVASTVADGANVTLGAKADAKSAATDTTAVTIMQVLKEISAMEQAPASQAVTNVGTFAVQATLQANTGVDIGKLTANQSVNVSQINGVTPLMGSGIMGTGSPRVTIASDNDPLIVKQATAANFNATVVGTGTFVTQSTLAAETTKVIGTVNISASQTIAATQGTASSLNATVVQGTANSIGNAWPVKQTDGTNTAIIDPCQGQTKTYVSISQTSGTQLISGTSAKKIYVCSLNILTATAQNAALVEGTGTVCATGIAGVQGFGGSTAGTGWNFPANGGLTYGNGGYALGAEGTNADNMCLLQSSSGQITGGLSYVVQ